MATRNRSANQHLPTCSSLTMKFGTAPLHSICGKWGYKDLSVFLDLYASQFLEIRTHFT